VEPWSCKTPIILHRDFFSALQLTTTTTTTRKKNNKNKKNERNKKKTQKTSANAHVLKALCNNIGKTWEKTAPNLQYKKRLEMGPA